MSIRPKREEQTAKVLPRMKNNSSAQDKIDNGRAVI